MTTAETRRMCAVAWMRHRATGGGNPYHEPDADAAPEGLRLTTRAGYDVPVQVCKHCGCVYAARLA